MVREHGAAHILKFIKCGAFCSMIIQLDLVKILARWTRLNVITFSQFVAKVLWFEILKKCFRSQKLQCYYVLETTSICNWEKENDISDLVRSCDCEHTFNCPFKPVKSHETQFNRGLCFRCSISQYFLVVFTKSFSFLAR